MADYGDIIICIKKCISVFIKHILESSSFKSNIKLILEDILGHGNSSCLLPGQLEHQSALACDRAGGLIFSSADINELAQELGQESIDARPYCYD